jgi:polysaccharide biosynthesis protein
MEIRGKRALVLGGAGLVGQAICRKLIQKGIGEIVVSSLFEKETNDFIEQLKKELGSKCPKLYAEWGNVFVRHALKDLSRNDLMNDAANRGTMIQDLLQPLNKDILKSSSMYHLCDKYKPEIVIDAINTATAISYQNLFGASKETYDIIKRASQEPNMSMEALESTEKLIITQYIPQLIRHVQIFLSSMVEIKTECYLKIGTCGTGGMGLNIPYTHSEDKPSQMLLAKSSMAGAHSLLLFLMGRTPGGPVIKELKPAAAIAWKKIACGPISRKGSTVLLEDVSFDNATELTGSLSKIPEAKIGYIQENGEPKPLVAPFVDTGENGVFSLGEFETITDEGQMEFITPEEIAQAAVWEIRGRNSGFDIVAALDNSTMGPTYRAGYMRKQALDQLAELVDKTGTESVAFEILGPPRLSKLLYEAYLFRSAYGTFEAAKSASAEEMSATLEEKIKGDKELLSRIASIGIPVLTADGKKLLRGNTIAIPANVPGKPDIKFDITSDNVNKWARDGWVDLRPSNMNVWKDRFCKIADDLSKVSSDDTSSHTAKASRYWTTTDKGTSIKEAKLASWIFIHEDEGERMKA